MENKELFTQISGMQSEDFVPPEYKLIQKTTSGVTGQPGLFWHSLRQETKKGIQAMILKITAVRTKWGRDEMSSDPPECSSDDASTFRSKDGQNCLECPHKCDNPWDYPQDERRVKCLKSYIILGIDLEEGEPFMLRASGVSAQPIKEFATNLRFRSLKGNKSPLRVSLTGVAKNTQYGTTYYVQPKIIGPLSDEDISHIMPLVTEMRALPIPVAEQPRLMESGTDTGVQPQNQYMKEIQDNQIADPSMKIDF
jgi:hypothetical protein